MRRRQLTLPSNPWYSAARKSESRDAGPPSPRAAALSWGALALSTVSLLLLLTSGSRRAVNNRPPIYLFTAPKPFVGIDAIHQTRALRSWLALQPPPRITLLGAGLETIALQHGVAARNVDSTFLGVPLFSAVVRAANESVDVPTDAVVVVLNADVVLFDDFPAALAKLWNKFKQHPWVALGGRWDVDSLPRQPRFWNDRSAAILVARIRSSGTLHTYGGVDAWAWPAGQLPSIDDGIPPFVMGRGRYDNWFTDALLKAGNDTAHVVDISEAVTMAHVRHDHHLVTTTATADTGSPESDAPFWIANPTARFELYVNAHLAATHGSFVAQQGTVLHAPLKLAVCARGPCLLQRRRPHACRCEHAPFVASAMSDPFVIANSRVILCGLRSTDIVEGRSAREIAARWPIHARPNSARAVFGLPLTLTDVLAVVKARISIAAIVLVVAGSGEEELLANTVCSARSTGVFDRLVVATMDDEVYRYGMLLGWPVFLIETPISIVSGEGVRARRRLYVANTLLSKGVSVAAVAPGVLLQVNITRHLGRTLEHGTDIAIVARGEAANTEFMFIRGSTRSARAIEKCLANAEVDPMQTLVEFACGGVGVAGQGKLCRNKQIRLQFFGDADVAFVERGKQHQEAAVLVPDDREISLMRLDILHKTKLALFDSSSKLCALR